MPDSFGPDGLEVKTATEIRSDLVNGVLDIYPFAQVEQNASDGQIIGIITQLAVDIRELIVQVNAGFDPDQAVGAILDQRVALNNITRQGGSYTTQPIDVVVNQEVTLQGLDGQFANPNGTGYTVQDGSGNQFILIDTTTLEAGTTSLSFRAQQIGNVQVPINTITVPVTIVVGVTSVNNSSAATTVGEDEETDAQLRTRRQQSVAIASTGYLNGLLAAVLNITGVTEAVIYENVGSATDGNGIPGHGIWLIVAGGANSDIGEQIYERKSYGANMKGSVAVDITTAVGTVFEAKFDRPSAENLYIDFSIQTTSTGFSFDTTSIKQYMADNIKYGIGQFAETSAITAGAVAAIANQGGGGVPVLVTISSDGISYTDYLTTSGLDKQWTLDPSRISISVLT